MRRFTFLFSFLSVCLFNIQAQKLVEINETLPDIDSTTYEQYGIAVSIDGDYAVIGSQGYNSNVGKAYVLHYNDSVWGKIAILMASDGAVDDYFGNSVAISGNTIVVGAYGDDDSASASGSAYIFEKTSEEWEDMSETAKLTPSDGASNYKFGFSVGVSENTIIVGAPGDDYNGTQTGSAYVFVKPDDGWKDTTQTAKLTHNGSGVYNYFGHSVAISGNTIAIGAHGFYGQASGGGSVYVYEKPSSGWKNMKQTARLYPSDIAREDYFGFSVSMSGNTIVAGSYKDDDMGSNSGSAYVYEMPDDGWVAMTETLKLTASDGADQDLFGSSVSISDSTIIIGSFQADVSEVNAGAAYIYLKTDSGWVDTTEYQKITITGGVQSDYFGRAVAVSGGNIVAGAYMNDDNGTNNGSAYFFNLAYPIEIDSQPASKSNMCGGSLLSYKIEGENIRSYKWQMSDDNKSTYEDIEDSEIFEGTNTETLVVTGNSTLNNNYFRCIVSNPAYSDTSNGAFFGLESEVPVITCIGDTEATTPLWNGYTVDGTEFDPTETSDNCEVGSITNDFNNDSTLADAFLPVGTTTIIWTITDKAGNTSTCSCDITISSTSSVDVEASVDYTLFPNPTTGTVNITLGNTENADLKIFSITGEKVYGNVYFTGGIVDLSEMNDGMYFVQLTSNGKTSVTKLMKK